MMVVVAVLLLICFILAVAGWHLDSKELRSGIKWQEDQSETLLAEINSLWEKVSIADTQRHQWKLDIESALGTVKDLQKKLVAADFEKVDLRKEIKSLQDRLDSELTNAKQTKCQLKGLSERHESLVAALRENASASIRKRVAWSKLIEKLVGRDA